MTIGGPKHEVTVNEGPPQYARRGHYLGTEVDGKWWRRYRGAGFFARGNGRYWADSEAFRFLRYLTRTPLEIPFVRVTTVETGTRHAGRWCMGIPVVKIVWEEDGRMVGTTVVQRRGSTDLWYVGTVGVLLVPAAGHRPKAVVGRARPDPLARRRQSLPERDRRQPPGLRAVRETGL